MPFYIKDKDRGLFVGEFLGLAFYEENIKDETLNPSEEAIPFDTMEQAQGFLDTWIQVPEGTEIIFKDK